MDNANIHHAKILKSVFSKLNIFYSAPYSPFLNPIEGFFAILKGRISKENYKNRKELIALTHKSI